MLAVDTERRRYAFLAGVFIGLAVITRPYSALAAALPPGLYLLWKTRSRPMIFLSVIGGGLPFLLLLFAYNHQLTGDILLPPAALAMSGDKNWGISADNFKNLLRFFLLSVSWLPPLLPIVFLGLLPELFSRTRRNGVAIIFPLMVIAYFFFTKAGGNQYGPRYYFEGVPVLVSLLPRNSFKEGLTTG